MNNDFVNTYLDEELSTIKKLNRDDILSVIKLLDSCLMEERHIYVMGNGGSSSTASHITNDFGKALFRKTDKRFKIICLSDNTSMLTAIANDVGYEEIYRYQLRNSLKKDDIVIAISGSGNSKNIINAVKYAKDKGATVIGFTGYDGGMLKKLADISLDTNINNMQITEDIHLIFEHLMISAFYDEYEMEEYKHE